jgi:hypothetical protein
MFSFLRKKTPATPAVLTVTLGGNEVGRVTQDELPTHKQMSLQIPSGQPELTFTDSQGQSYAHNLASALDEGLPWLHLDLRVSTQFAGEADALLSASPSDKVATEEFAGGGKAIRFQPFYLPESPADPNELVGKGFFYRGLHFQGRITPSNVSLSCICDQCRKSFRLQGFHAGFMDSTYFFCDNGPHTLIVSGYVEGAPPLLQAVAPETVAPFEAQLPSCERCGGNFRYLNPFLCPHCHAPYIDFARFPMLRAVEYYGCSLYGESIQRWEPQSS